MAKHGRLYELAAGRFSYRVSGANGRARYRLRATCSKDEYPSFIEIMCGAARCAGYTVVAERKPGERDPYHVTLCPTCRKSAKPFDLVFEVDGNVRYSLANRGHDDIYSLLVDFAVKCQSFGNGNRVGFDEYGD